MDLIGREREIDPVAQAIAKGGHVLLTGRPGIGKSALLGVLAERTRNAVVFPSGTPRVSMLAALENLHRVVGLRVPEALLPPSVALRAKQRGFMPWANLRSAISKLTLDRQAELFHASLVGNGCVVFVDSLEIPPSLANEIGSWFDVAQVVAARDDGNRRARIERLLWRFTTTIEIKPLPTVEARALVEHAIEVHQVQFSEAGVRDRFVQHVAQQSGGVPAAILGMVEAAGAEHEVTPGSVTNIKHEAGIRYLDMTPVVVIGVIAMVAVRYISRGISSQELLIFSGVASALFMMARIFLFAARRR